MTFTSGRPETMCGAGSLVSYTTGVRAWLPVLMRELGVRTLLDAPCGDFNWMAHTDLSGIGYIGADYDPAHRSMATDRDSVTADFRPRSKVIVDLDLVREGLPHADMMLCREFMQHLPNVQAAEAIRNFLVSGIQLLLATSHGNAVNGDIERPGDFRPLNLMMPPFSFPPPRHSIKDGPGSGRILGLWHRSDLQEHECRN